MSGGTTLHDGAGDPTGRENIHPQVLPYFPNYRYWEPATDHPQGPPEVLTNFRDARNAVGHQQRAFSVYWALKTCGPLDLGIDVGSCRGMTPHCIHVDVNGNGKPHPFYGGGPYRSDAVMDASDLSPIFPSDTFPLVTSNHSLEHMPAKKFGGGDKGIVEVLKGWIALLRQGGTLAMIVPDNDHFDVLASDKDHWHAWGARDFRPRVLDAVLTATGAELVEYDTLKNRFSFNVVVVRR